MREMLALGEANGYTQLANQASTVGNEGPQLSYFFWRYPYGWDEIGGQETSQVQGITCIGLHASSSNDFDEQRMSNRHEGDQRTELITEILGIRRCFQHHSIGLAQMLLTPEEKFNKAQPDVERARSVARR